MEIQPKIIRGAVPFKYLVIQDGDYVMVTPEKNIREAFKAFHHRPLKAGFKLWIIPAAVRVQPDFSYTFPKGAVLFDWVEVEGVK